MEEGKPYTINRVQYYPWPQVSQRGLGTCPVWMGVEGARVTDKM